MIASDHRLLWLLATGLWLCCLHHNPSNSVQCGLGPTLTRDIIVSRVDPQSRYHTGRDQKCSFKKYRGEEHTDTRLETYPAVPDLL